MRRYAVVSEADGRHTLTASRDWARTTIHIVLAAMFIGCMVANVHILVSTPPFVLEVCSLFGILFVCSWVSWIIRSRATSSYQVTFDLRTGTCSETHGSVTRKCLPFHEIRLIIITGSAGLFQRRVLAVECQRRSDRIVVMDVRTWGPPSGARRRKHREASHDESRSLVEETAERLSAILECKIERRRAPGAVVM